MKPELTIDINLNITDETAVLCAGLLDMYCGMMRGDFDIGYDACNRCALISKTGYCNYRHIQAFAVSKQEGEQDEGNVLQQN